MKYKVTTRSTIIAALIECFLAFAVSARTYYVDFVGGSDYNSGTSTGLPWKHCPGDGNTTGVPSGVILAPGDFVKFKGGISYIGGFKISWSGNRESPITYDGNSDGDWGSGRAVVDAQNVSTTCIVAPVAKNYITIKGFEIKNVGGYPDRDPLLTLDCSQSVTFPVGGKAIDFSNGGNNLRFENLYVHRIGQWRNQAPFSGVGGVTGSGIGLRNCDGVIVTGCEFTEMHTGVSVKATSVINNVTITNSRFHDNMVWLIDVSPQLANATISNITIDSCTFYNYFQFESGNWLGCDEKPHVDGIFLRTSSFVSTWKNVIVRNCLFYADNPTGRGGTASIYLDQGASADIYNCLFLNDTQSNGGVCLGEVKIAGMFQRLRLWNNTFVGTSRSLVISYGASNPNAVDVRNNIFWRMRTGNANAVTLDRRNIGSLTMDNNVYFMSDPVAANSTVIYDGAYRTLASWQSASGQDRHSMAADPLLVNTVGIASFWNVALSANSPARAAGFNLMQYFQNDKAKRPRPVRKGWSIGALQFNTVPATPQRNRLVGGQ